LGAGPGDRGPRVEKPQEPVPSNLRFAPCALAHS
jgi:hypothetical protein